MIGFVQRWMSAIAFFGLLVFAKPAFALWFPPALTYSQLTPGNRFIFVMFADPRNEQSPFLGVSQKRIEDARDLRKRFPRSGMYRNDGSTTQLWTFDEYIHPVELAADGIHMIRRNHYGRRRGGVEMDNLFGSVPELTMDAVSFYANGRLNRSYAVNELIDDAGSLPYIGGGWYTWSKECRFVSEFEYTITTLDGNHFVFDVRTGAIITETRPGKVMRFVYRVLGLGTLFITATYITWRVRRARRDGGK